MGVLCRFSSFFSFSFFYSSFIVTVKTVVIEWDREIDTRLMFSDNSGSFALLRQFVGKRDQR